MKHKFCLTTAFVAIIGIGSPAQSHEYACHRAYIGKEATIGFYEKSFHSAELLHTKVLGERMEAGRFLEVGVLQDIKGEHSEEALRASFKHLQLSRKYMDELHAVLGQMIEHEAKNKPLPEHKIALQRILANQPPIERVSMSNNRFANISGAHGVAVNYGPIGKDFPELLKNLRSDLEILIKQHDGLLEAFRAALPVANSGGFAAMVLSGRAPLPEKVMHTADQIIVYTQFYDRACMSSIAADMQVYPKGFEWLPQVNWKTKKAQ